MGLLLSHKRKLRVWNDMLSLSVPADHEQVGGGERGEVKVFSKASRYRLFKSLHRIKFKTITFITLTYPAKFPTNPRVYKAHLKEYRRRFEIRWGKLPAVWRLEFQQRGAPHFHILYFDCPFIPVQDWSSLWAEVTHSNDENHRKAGVELDLITDNSQEKLVAFYVGKYIAKVDEEQQNGNSKKCGRWWGKWNVVEEDPIEIEVTDRQAEFICTYALTVRGRGTSWRPDDPTICTVFGDKLGGSEFSFDILRLAKNLPKI